MTSVCASGSRRSSYKAPSLVQLQADGPMLCKNCEIEFAPSQVTQKFCSKSCGVNYRSRAYRARQKAKGSPAKGGNTEYFVNRPCAQCGKTIGARKKREQTFCSTNCASISRKKYLDIPDCLESASRKLDKNLGYVRVYAPMHPEANTWGYVYEHRLIAEEKILKRRLEPNEVVHHRNGKRWDNRLANLEVMDKHDHSRLGGQREEDLNI